MVKHTFKGFHCPLNINQVFVLKETQPSPQKRGHFSKVIRRRKKLDKRRHSGNKNISVPMNTENV